MRIKVRGVRLYVDIEGAELRPCGNRMREYPTIILIHSGPGSDHSEFKTEYAHLRNHARLIYVDLRGHGRSDLSNSGKWTLSEWAKDIRALCKVLGIEKPFLLGLSFGSFVVQEYARRYPQNTSGLILTGASAKLNLADFLDRLECLSRKNLCREPDCDCYAEPDKCLKHRENRVRENVRNLICSAAQSFCGDEEIRTKDYAALAGNYYLKRPQEPSTARRILWNDAVQEHFFRLRPRSDRVRCLRSSNRSKGVFEKRIRDRYKKRLNPLSYCFNRLKYALLLWEVGEGHTFDFRYKLDKVDCRVLIIVGSEDPITPPSDAVVLYESLSSANTTLRLVANSGHPVAFDRMHAELCAIRWFIRGCTVRDDYRDLKKRSQGNNTTGACETRSMENRLPSHP